jgi:hypothetical protein
MTLTVSAQPHKQIMEHSEALVKEMPSFKKLNKELEQEAAAADKVGVGGVWGEKGWGEGSPCPLLRTAVLPFNSQSAAGPNPLERFTFLLRAPPA